MNNKVLQSIADTHIHEYIQAIIPFLEMRQEAAKVGNNDAVEKYNRKLSEIFNFSESDNLIN